MPGPGARDGLSRIVPDVVTAARTASMKVADPTVLSGRNGRNGCPMRSAVNCIETSTRRAGRFTGRANVDPNRKGNHMKTAWILLFSTLGITPAWAADSPAAPHHGERRAMMEKHCAENPDRCKEMRAQMEQRRAQCQADPAKCREERRAMMEKSCAENPQRCKEMKADMAQRKAQCKADPEKCRQEHQARAAEHFKKADVDGNGTLSKAEAEKGMPRMARNFEAIDGNKDGQLSRDELEVARKARHAGKAGHGGHGAAERRSGA